MMPEDVLFLDETGLLFQINRMILHPLGLEIYRDGERLEIHSSQEEELLFDPVSYQEGMRRFRDFMLTYGEKRAFDRYKQLGFVIQENPEGVPVAEH